MITFAIFDETTGRITQVGSVEHESYLAVPPGFRCLRGVDLSAEQARLSYVETGGDAFYDLRPRPSVAPPEGGIAVGASITLDVPSGASIWIDESMVGVSDGEPVEIKFETDGLFRLRVTPDFPWLPLDALVKVTP